MAAEEATSAEGTTTEVGLPPSLLDTISDRFKRQQRQSFSRIVVAAKVTDKFGQGDSVLQMVNKVNAAFPKDSGVTGFGLLQSGTCLLLLECVPDAIPMFVRLLVDGSGEGGQGELMSGMRVVAQSEDVGQQYFLPFEMLLVNLPKEGDIDLEQEEGDLTTAGSNMYVKLMQVGQAMAGKGAYDDKFKTTHASFLPTSDRVRAFSLCSGFFSVDEFISTLCNPVHVRLESDLVWPMEERLVY